MGIVGDSKAYVILQKHGALIDQLANRAVILTVEGRVFILTFLLFTGHLTKEGFNAIATSSMHPSMIGVETGKAIREACEKWLTGNDANIKFRNKKEVPPTDVTYGQMAFLMSLLVAVQEQIEYAATGRKPQ